MTSSIDDIKERIPQRDPFLFVSEIIEQSDNKITTCYNLTGEESFFQGHFPGKPVLPGVIIQEALFQSGALLMSFIESENDGIGVVTRVQGAKFKKLIEPPGRLIMKVELVDSMGGGYFFKGRLEIDDKTVAAVDFSCALA